MSNKIIFLILSLFLISANKTIALTGVDLRATIAVERQDLKTTIIEQRKSTLSQIKKDKLTAIYDTIKNRLQTRYQLKLGHKASIDSLITQKEQAGKDMTTAKTQLANFTQYETAYQIDLIAFNVKYQSLLDSATPLKLVPELKAAAKKVSQDLVEMNKVLRKTVEIIIKVSKKPTNIPSGS